MSDLCDACSFILVDHSYVRHCVGAFDDGSPGMKLLFQDCFEFAHSCAAGLWLCLALSIEASVHCLIYCLAHGLQDSDHLSASL